MADTSAPQRKSAHATSAQILSGGASKRRGGEENSYTRGRECRPLHKTLKDNSPFAAEGGGGAEVLRKRAGRVSKLVMRRACVRRRVATRSPSTRRPRCTAFPLRSGAERNAGGEERRCTRRCALVSRHTLSLSLSLSLARSLDRPPSLRPSLALSPPLPPLCLLLRARCRCSFDRVERLR